MNLKNNGLIKIWIKIGEAIGFVNSRIILAILFYFLFTPIGIVQKIFGVDLLGKKINKSSESYFTKRTEIQSSMNYQF